MKSGELMIQELLTLEEIEDAEEQYKKQYGKEPFRISTWNPSLYYQDNVLLNRVKLPTEESLIDYIYSYELEDALVEKIRGKLSGGSECVPFITNSGTASIALTTSVLAQLGLCRFLILNPTYFAVFYNCLEKGINVRESYMRHQNGTYQLPKEEIRRILPEVDVIWLTNPIYNTGVSFSAADVGFLKENVLPQKYLVVDECFCENGLELVRLLGSSPHFIGIYDPMKLFLLNGAKFSVIMFPPALEDTFTQWSDIVCGSLSFSTLQAISFYLSDHADQLKYTINTANKHILKQVRKTICEYPLAYLDENIVGHMMMCYLPQISAKSLSNFSDFLRFQLATGVSIIPGTRFRFLESEGLSFRINMARYDPVLFLRAITKTCAFFFKQ